MSITFTFSYQEFRTSKIITDFTYKIAYQLSIKTTSINKVVDKVVKEDIVITKLPSKVNINKIKSSKEYPNGLAVKITFSGGNVLKQELNGFLSYQAKTRNFLKALLIMTFQLLIKQTFYQVNILINNHF